MKVALIKKIVSMRCFAAMHKDACKSIWDAARVRPEILYCVAFCVDRGANAVHFGAQSLSLGTQGVSAVFIRHEMQLFLCVQRADCLRQTLQHGWYLGNVGKSCLQARKHVAMLLCRGMSRRKVCNTF